ncbi:MAG: SUMF1/EgtB/PvdO family nonheme iron enzyme [Treponema sp.]|nr:SUMF1/EgtB/PvdO family nonheme iron enzyme [Treponema sp.]
MTALKTFLVFLALAFFPLWVLSAQQKYALVIGNGVYTNITGLNNPVNDANDVTTALQGLGFQVDKVLNGNLEQMEKAVERLKNRLSNNGSAYGFFFYAGHGVQSGGENYLIPVDANIGNESSLRLRALSVQVVLDELSQASNRLNIVVLDACRDNPFGWSRGTSRGLVVLSNPPADSIIVYATAAGSVASDGQGRNGLFTSQMLKNLKTPSLEIREVFRRTRADVRSASSNAQLPALYDQFDGLAYLNVMAPQTPRNVRAGTPGTDRVTLTWDSAGSGVSYKVYYNTQNDPARASTLGDLATGTSMDVTGMASGTTYYFWVSSVQGGEESGKSPVVTILTAAVRPNVPSDMVKINGGTFMMGSPASEASLFDDEVQHRVTVFSFYMGKYEVTVGEFRQFVNATGYKTTAETSGGGYVWTGSAWETKADANWKNPYFTQSDNHPVVLMSWYDVVNYCNWRSQRESLTSVYTINGTNVTWNRNANGYRLPTEAEWEYACRAGTTTAYNSGATAESLVGKANVADLTAKEKNPNWTIVNIRDGYVNTAPVGSFASNSWGLYDMHGNVWEWCWDWYGSYSSGAQTDPLGASSGTNRVGRGGSWTSNGQDLRSASRGSSTPSYRYYYLGFRLARPSL